MEGVMLAPELTDESFDEFLSGAALPVMIDFWASWCRPCAVVSPLLESIANDNEDRLMLAKVNVETSPVLAARFEIQSIPTLIVFVASAPVTTIIGVMPRRYIETELGISLGWQPKPRL